MADLWIPNDPPAYDNYEDLHSLEAQFVGIDFNVTTSLSQCPPHARDIPRNNLRFCYVNLVDLTDTTISSDIETNPTYVQSDLRSKYAQTTTLSGRSMTFDWGGSDNLVNFIHIDKHNLTKDATITFTLYSEQNALGTVLAQITPSCHLNLSQEDFAYETYTPNTSVFTDWESNKYFTTGYFSDSYSCKSAKLEIDDPTNTDGFLQVGRVFIGYYIMPFDNPQWGLSLDWIDEINYNRSYSGSVNKNTKGTQQRRSLKFGFDRLEDGERAWWFKMLRNLKGRSVFVSVFAGLGGSKERDYCLLGKLTKSSGITHPVYDTFNLKNVIIEEL